MTLNFKILLVQLVMCRDNYLYLRLKYNPSNANMSNIQDIHAFAERIYDIVQDYVDGNYNADDVLAIGKRCGKITLKADAKEAIKVGKSTELYPLKDLLRTGDNGKMEPDNDRISEIANSWVFLD